MAHNAKCFIVEAGWEKPRAARGKLRRETSCRGSQTERCKMEEMYLREVGGNLKEEYAILIVVVFKVILKKK